MTTGQAIWEFVVQWYWVPLTLIYVGIIITIISENRNPGKSLAYILVLVFLPVVGIVIYYFVGRKPVFKKRTFSRKQVADRIMMQRYFAQLKPQMEERMQWLEQQIGGMVLPFRYLYYQRQSLISMGNRVTLLNNGEEKFPALFEALQHARAHIHLEYYILTADEVGNRLADILIQKHREGVEVRVIVDDVGSNRIGSIPRRLRQAGIALLKTMPVAFTSLANSNYRNHRKLVVIDGEIGFIGGINLDARYWNKGRRRLYWRDTAVRIEGPAVNLLQVQFFLSWFFSGGKEQQVDESAYFKNPVQPRGHAVVAFAASGPGSAAPYVMETILLALSQAQRNIRICTPYFIPSDQLTSVLVIAAARGVQVELLLPERSDSYLVQHASFSFLKPLLLRGVQVYLYQKGFMHAKTIAVDDSLVFVGTVNMDTRSFFLNFEITALVYEPALCCDYINRFEQDKQHSRLLTIQQWEKRPLLYKGLDSVCRLVAPLL